MLDENDFDLGGSGLLQLPSNSFGTSAHPNIGAITGKDGIMYVVDVDNLGGYKQGTNGGDKVIQKLKVGGTGHEVRSWGAVYLREQMVYYVSHGEPIKAFKYSSNTGRFSFVGQTSTVFGNRSGSLAITAIDNTAGTGIVWIYDSLNSQLLTYHAVPSSGVLAPIRAFDMNGCKFTTPTFDGGKVYMATCDGRFIMLA